MSNYQTVNPDKVVSTIDLLQRRIDERFPDSGLSNICGQLLGVAQNMKQRAEWIARPVRWLRFTALGVCVLIVVLTLLAFYFYGFNEKEMQLNPEQKKKSFAAFVTVMEAGINDVVLIGAAFFFLLTFETRYKRKRALKALHELRSIAHIIDMHQLTKDPHRITDRKKFYVPQPLSPKLEMDSFQLRRYLDYCSEMLALTGKVAAVYVQAFDDAVAIASASELETLTSGLSQKIWQKIQILETWDHHESPSVGIETE